jgi:probable phosphoglycerate mutase
MPERSDLVRITVVRHGATEWSRSGRHTGRTDLPLESGGEDEARRIADRLQGLRPALVLSSPLRRALDTCKLAGFGDAVATDNRLLEMDYGAYEGLTTAEIRKTRPDWDLFADGCPGGETVEDVGRRADSIIGELLDGAVYDGAEVLIFAHGHVLRVLAARWIRLGPREASHFTLASGGIGELRWEHEWPVLASWNR